MCLCRVGLTFGHGLLTKVKYVIGVSIFDTTDNSMQTQARMQTATHTSLYGVRRAVCIGGGCILYAVAACMRSGGGLLNTKYVKHQVQK